jgi:hypothetical protein
MVMGISLSRIAELHPVVYHMAEHGTWESIKRHGLLSTSALLDRFGIVGSQRETIEGMLRKRPIQINVPNNGEVTIRDHRMSNTKLARCLRDGLIPADWYRLLNGKVFFWLTQERLITLMKAYADREHLVLEIDTSELLKRHGDRVMLTPMNTGTTTPMAFPRGRNSFQPPHKYPFEMNKKKKGGEKKAIVELTVEHSVCDVSEFTIRATHQRFDKTTAQAVLTEIVHC